MKKIFYLVVVFTVLIAVVFVYAKVSNDVQDSIDLINDSKNEIEKVIGVIQGTADKLQTSLIGTIDKNIRDSLNPSVATIKSAEEQVEKIPDMVLKVVRIGDLKDTLAAIRLLVDDVKDFLQKDVQGVFSKYVDAFDKNRDSKGIHKLLNSSLDKFRDAREKLEELKGYLIELGM